MMDGTEDGVLVAGKECPQEQVQRWGHSGHREPSRDAPEGLTAHSWQEWGLKVLLGSPVAKFMLMNFRLGGQPAFPGHILVL